MLQVLIMIRIAAIFFREEAMDYNYGIWTQVTLKSILLCDSLLYSYNNIFYFPCAIKKRRQGGSTPHEHLVLPGITAKFCEEK